MPEDKLEQLVSEYADLAKDKNIDATALLINALERKNENLVPTRTKRWAYLISIGVPPVGVLFAAWFYFSDYEDRKSAAIMCLVLTVFASILGYLLLKATLSGSGVTPTQLQQIQPQEIYELTQ